MPKIFCCFQKGVKVKDWEEMGSTFTITIEKNDLKNDFKEMLSISTNADDNNESN